MFEIANVDIDEAFTSTKLGEVSYRMNLMYTLLDDNEDYFYGYFDNVYCQLNNSRMVVQKSDTPFETDVQISDSQKPQKKIDKLVKKYREVLKYYNKINIEYAEEYGLYLEGYQQRLDFVKDKTVEYSQAIYNPA